MQASWIETLIFPVITGLILLAIEYFAIQPWLRYRESKFLVSKDIDTGGNGRKWSDGIRNGIRQFKQHANNHNWGGISIKQHFVVISNFYISKGQAEVILLVNIRYLLDKQRPVGKYRIVIDRVGDIKQLETISVRKNPFDNQEFPFPGSWFAVGLIVLAIMMFRLMSLPLQSQPQQLVTDGFFYSTPVSQLWTQASSLTTNSSTNGTLGKNEIDLYSFKTDVGGTLTIEVVPVDNFFCYLSIYNQTNSLIRRIPTYGRKISMEIAPELNVNYLVIIEPSGGSGSYILNLSLSP